MKLSTLSMAVASALLGTVVAHASEFSGSYLGGRIGYNENRPATSTTSDKAFPGLQGGHGWDKGEWMLAVEGFYDHHTKSVTGRDYGADLKIGLPSDKLMPYAKLGLAGSDPGTRLHGGVGIEYKFAPQWSVLGEWTLDTKSVNSVDQKNNNISVGLNYYFGKPAVAPVMVAAPVVVPPPPPPPEPVVVEPPPAPLPEPVVAVEPPPPAPVPEPAPRTIFTDKPITIEGASFDTNSAKLKPTAFQQLDVVVEFADKYKDANLTVVGYTDSRGNESYNQKLSAKRAESVKAYLVGKGVAADRIITDGKGSANPVGDNKTAAGQAQNRRVEINSVERVAEVVK